VKEIGCQVVDCSHLAQTPVENFYEYGSRTSGSIRGCVFHEYEGGRGQVFGFIKKTTRYGIEKKCIYSTYFLLSSTHL
jgi:hypothetical protein